MDGCEKKFIDPHKRRLHLIDRHRYPKDYDFSLTRMPRQGRQGASLPPRLRPAPPAAARAAAGAVAAMEADPPVPTTMAPASASAPVSRPALVPRQVAFGRGQGKAFPAAPRKAAAAAAPVAAPADDAAMIE